MRTVVVDTYPFILACENAADTIAALTEIVANLRKPWLGDDFVDDYAVVPLADCIGMLDDTSSLIADARNMLIEACKEQNG